MKMIGSHSCAKFSKSYQLMPRIACVMGRAAFPGGRSVQGIGRPPTRMKRDVQRLCGSALRPQDLQQGGLPALELLRSGLAGREEALDLVPDGVDGPADAGVR